MRLSMRTASLVLGAALALGVAPAGAAGGYALAEVDGSAIGIAGCLHQTEVANDALALPQAPVGCLVAYRTDAGTHIVYGEDLPAHYGTSLGSIEDVTVSSTALNLATVDGETVATLDADLPGAGHVELTGTVVPVQFGNTWGWSHACVCWGYSMTMNLSGDETPSALDYAGLGAGTNGPIAITTLIEGSVGGTDVKNFGDGVVWRAATSGIVLM